MDIVANTKQITNEEKDQISHQVQADLIEHLYEGALPGVVSGVAASIAFFLMFYGFTPTYLLIIWVICFNLMLAILASIYFIYIKNRNRFSLRAWQTIYSLVMIGCALLWVPMVFLMPDDLTRQFLAMIALFMLATAYATGTIGQFYLCIITLILIVLPLTVWTFAKGGIFYNLVGFYSLIYVGFMFGANHRSTQWFKDSLKLKLENTLVSYQANHDLLTDLPNQRVFPQYVEAAINIAKNTGKTFAVTCFSLNRMEIINDSLGIEASNSIIKSVANRLNLLAEQEVKTSETRYLITISRKDTFDILVVPLNPDQTDHKLNQLFSVLDEPFYIAGKEIRITASIGVSFYPKDGMNTQSLLINADAAMLRAKQFGSNRIEFYRSEINAQAPKKLELENDLNVAIKNNELVLFYQPLVDAISCEIIGMEALIRWQHPTHGFISPGNFIPLAEETGLIVPIGAWVLEEACRQTKIWHEMGFSSLHISVNVAEKQMRQENIIDIVNHALEKTGFDVRYLELEITETAILDEAVIHLIKKFKQMGLSLAVDDFGTGYSGLSYLKRFSIDKLKIDQSFIHDIPGNNDSITIVSAIIAMAKELKVKTLGEGVETEQQLQFLRSKGCDYIQGYYFSKPMDANNFTKLMYTYRNLPAYVPMEKSIIKEDEAR